MITEVRNKIFALANTVVGLVNKVFYVEAIQGTTFPYAVFSQVSNPASRDSASRFEEIYFQISVFAKTASLVESLAALVVAKFDDCETSFILASYWCTRIEKEFTRSDKNEDVFQITIQYKLDLTKK